MDTNSHRLTNNTTWEAAGMVVENNMQQYAHVSSFDTFWLQNHHHHHTPSSSSQFAASPGLIRDQTSGNDRVEDDEEPEEELGAMKEMMFKIAAMQPVDIDPATIRKPKRRNVRISNDPQSVAARHRRERISERMRILQRLVPGGTKMDTASMLEEAIRYVKFLKRQVRQLQANHQPPPSVLGFPACLPTPGGDHWANNSIITSTKPLGSTTCTNGGNRAAHDDPICPNNNYEENMEIRKWCQKS